MKASRLTPKQIKAASDAARREVHATPPKKMWNDGGATAAKKPAAVKLLSSAEYAELESLISQAAESNVRVFCAAREVDELRLRLNSAEGELKSAREQNAKIHSGMAPLFHRLPA